MIEPITYLYYCCYKLFCKFEENNTSPESGELFAVIVYVNINGAVDLIGGRLPSLVVFGVSLLFVIVLEIIISLFESKIVKKYDGLSHNQRRIGKMVFIVEILLTISSIVILVT